MRETIRYHRKRTNEWTDKKWQDFYDNPLEFMNKQNKLLKEELECTKPITPHPGIGKNRRK